MATIRQEANRAMRRAYSAAREGRPEHADVWLGAARKFVEPHPSQLRRLHRAHAAAQPVVIDGQLTIHQEEDPHD